MKKTTIIALLHHIHDLQPDIFFGAIRFCDLLPEDDEESEWALFERLSKLEPKLLHNLLSQLINLDDEEIKKDRIRAIINKLDGQFGSLSCIESVIANEYRDEANHMLLEWKDEYNQNDWEEEEFLRSFLDNMEGSEDEYDFTMGAVKRYIKRYFGYNFFQP